MGDKKVLLGLGALVILLLIGGIYYALSSQKSSSRQASITPEVQNEEIPEISPEELGLTLTLRSDKKAIKFEIANASDIESVEYQISYMKMLNDEEIPEGLIGEVKKKSQDKKIAIDYREFGTCSSGVCRYDKVISPVTVTLKIVKQDGKVYQAEDKINL